MAAVERKSVRDLVGSVISGKLRYPLGDLAALPRAAVVVEDGYSAVAALNDVASGIDDPARALGSW